VGAVFVWLALAAPMLAMPLSGTDSQDADAAVFYTQDLIEERFQTSVYTPLFVIEAREGALT